MGDKAEQMLKEFVPAAAAAFAAPIAGAAAGAGAAGAGAAGAGAYAGELGLGATAAEIAAADAAAAGAGGAYAGELGLGATPEMLAIPEAAGGTGLDYALASGALPGGLEMGGEAAMLAPYAGPSADPAFLAGNTPLGSPYSGWLDKATATIGDKLKNPRTQMMLGQMLAQSGAKPKQQGAPMGDAFAQPSMRSALASQEEITKKWLRINDPNTYRRIYGEPEA